MQKYVNGVLTDMTAEEIADFIAKRDAGGAA